MSHAWPYFRLRPDGTLIDDKTLVPVLVDFKDGSTPVFKDAAEAEAYLELHDIRGSVR